LALLPFELRLLVRLAALLLPFEFPLVLALAVPFELRLLFALVLRFELARLLAPDARPGLPVERALVGWPELPRRLPRGVPEARVFPAPEVGLRVALVRFVVLLCADGLPVAFDVRLGPLRLPSFDTNPSIASRGASTVFRAPLATFAGA
jgi:hypothetical protein